MIPLSAFGACCIALTSRQGEDGRVRHVRDIDEKLVERPKTGYVEGARVVIERGIHAGLHGVIKSVSSRNISDDILLFMIDIITDPNGGWSTEDRPRQ